MIALTLLLLAIGWLLVATVTGFFAYWGTRKRWIQITITLVVLWLPFWDVIPGWILYQKVVKEVGGVRIYKTVEAEGYLDRSATDCYSCWSRLKDSPYRYMEVVVSTRDPTPGSSLTPVPGVYEFRLLERGNANCQAFEALPNAENLRRIHRLGESCVSATRRNAPLSLYEYESSRGWQEWVRMSPLPPIESAWQVVRALSTSEVVAEAYTIRYVSWLGTHIYLPRWTYTESDAGRFIAFEITDVLIPI